jgi:hypothetical protein
MAARRHAAELGVKPYAANLDEICALELSPGELATICREVSARVYGLEAAR